MDLNSTILGLLSLKPSSGYDLKRIISDSEIFYWSGNNNQIYKSLIEMQKEGLLTCEFQVQENLPAKKIYTITDLGLTALRRSLLEEPEVPEVRKNFLIQLACAELMSDDEILVLLEKYEGEIEARLCMYRAKVAGMDVSRARSEREQFLWNRIGENLITTCQAELDWAHRTLQEFREANFSG